MVIKGVAIKGVWFIAELEYEGYSCVVAYNVLDGRKQILQLTTLPVYAVSGAEAYIGVVSAYLDWCNGKACSNFNLVDKYAAAMV